MAREQHGLATGDEPPGGKVPDLAAVDGGLRGEVEPGEVALEREPCQAEAHLDPALAMGLGPCVDGSRGARALFGWVWSVAAMCAASDLQRMRCAP